MYLSPADYIITTFGGVRSLAKVLDVSPSTVSRWSTRVNRYGESGNIPNSMHKTIIRISKKHGVDICANDLIYGRSIKKR